MGKHKEALKRSKKEKQHPNNYKSLHPKTQTKPKNHPQRKIQKPKTIKKTNKTEKKMQKPQTIPKKPTKASPKQPNLRFSFEHPAAAEGLGCCRSGQGSRPGGCQAECPGGCACGEVWSGGRCALCRFFWGGGVGRWLVLLHLMGFSWDF